MHPLLSSRSALAALALVASASVGSPAAAQFTSGSKLVFTGVADAIDLGSPGVFLDFDRRVTADPAANTGMFSSLNAKPTKHGGKPAKGANGSIRSMTVGNGIQPVGKFVQFGPYKFDLLYVPSGSYGQDECYVEPEVGQRCTPYQSPGYELSPFYLENLAPASGSDAAFTALIKFDVAGVVTAHGRSSLFTGTFTTMFEGVSFQEALGGLEAYGLEDVPFTGEFVTATPAFALFRSTTLGAQATVTPEPATVTLLAIGLVGVAGVARRRARRR